MKASNFIFAAAIFSVFLISSAQADELFEVNTSRPGSSYRHFELSETDPVLCKKACEREVQCRSWTYVNPGIQGNKAVCWLKNDIPQPAYNICCISGIKQISTSYTAQARVEQEPSPEAEPLVSAPAPIHVQQDLPLMPVSPNYYNNTVQAQIAQAVPMQMKVRQAAFKIPIAHVWEYLNHFGNEPKGYAAYSYILTGRNGSDKYAELVKRIQGSTLPAAQAAEAKTFLPDELNIFLIPAINTRGSAYKPDYAVSKNLLTVLGARSKLSFDRPGPFIITLYHPVSSIPRGPGEMDMLYVDLTNVNKGAIAELIRTYKKAVLEEKLDGMQKLKSLRLSILNLAFMTEESLGFAKAAYGAVYPVLFGGDE